MELFIILMFVAVIGHTVSSLAPLDKLKLNLLLNPRELQYSIRSTRHAKAIEASRASANAMVLDHKKALEAVRESRQKELEHFDYQLFEIERVPLMRSVTDRSYSVIHQDTSLEEAKTFLTEIIGLSNDYTRFSSVDNLIDYRMAEDLKTLADIADEVKDRVSTMERAVRREESKRQLRQGGINAEKRNDAAAISKGGVPYLATPVQVLDYIEIVKDENTPYLEQVAATKVFLGTEWDQFAFYFDDDDDDDDTVHSMVSKVEEKLARSIKAEGFEEAVHQEMLRRYEKAQNKEKLMKIWGWSEDSYHRLPYMGRHSRNH